MRVVVKKTYYFDENDKKKFKIWLIQNSLTYTKIAESLGVSVSYLNQIINGTKPLNDKIIFELNRLGFKLNVKE